MLLLVMKTETNFVMRALTGALVVGSVALAVLLCGCAQTSMSNPSRTATEQLLISTAADRALTAAPWSRFSGKRIFLDATYLESYDAKYVLGTIRDSLSRAGAILANNVTNSEITLEVRSGTLSIDPSESLIGIPKTGVPLALAGTLEVPEIALYKASRQYAMAKLTLLAYATEERTHVYSSRPMLGKAYNKYYSLLWLLKWNATDLPEKKKKR